MPDNRKFKGRADLTPLVMALAGMGEGVELDPMYAPEAEIGNMPFDKPYQSENPYKANTWFDRNTTKRMNADFKMGEVTADNQVNRILNQERQLNPIRIEGAKGIADATNTSENYFKNLDRGNELDWRIKSLKDTAQPTVDFNKVVEAGKLASANNDRESVLDFHNRTAKADQGRAFETTANTQRSNLLSDMKVADSPVAQQVLLNDMQPTQLEAARVALKNRLTGLNDETTKSDIASQILQGTKQSQITAGKSAEELKRMQAQDATTNFAADIKTKRLQAALQNTQIAQGIADKSMQVVGDGIINVDTREWVLKPSGFAGTDAETRINPRTTSQPSAEQLAQGTEIDGVVIPRTANKTQTNTTVTPAPIHPNQPTEEERLMRELLRQHQY